MKKEHTEQKTKNVGWTILKIILVLLGIALLTVGIPLLIDNAFKCPDKIIMVAWDAAATLGYYGDVLGFLGTVIFSGLALWQNHVIKTESDKHTDLLERMENQKNMPKFHVGSRSMGGKCANLNLYLENISDNLATEILLSEIKIINEDGTIFWSNGKEQRIPHLKDSRDINLKNPSLESIKQIFYFQITYIDKFGELHQCDVEGRQIGEAFSFPRFIIKEKFF